MNKDEKKVDVTPEEKPEVEEREMLVIDGKTPSYQRIEFSLYGKIYRVKYPLTIPLMAKAEKFEQKAIKGDAKSMAMQISILTDAPYELVINVDIWEMTKILKYITESIADPEGVFGKMMKAEKAKRLEKEKNSVGSGTKG